MYRERKILSPGPEGKPPNFWGPGLFLLRCWSRRPAAGTSASRSKTCRDPRRADFMSTRCRAMMSCIFVSLASSNLHLLSVMCFA